MNDAFTDVYEEGEFQHFYGTARSHDAILSSLLPRSRPVIVHFHSSVLTCGRNEHALLVPKQF